jgi:hypothetical protein
MTKQQHPITPPPELRSKWFNEAPKTDLYDYIIEQAAQWGADQELEACCEWFRSTFGGHASWVDELRATRRLKPPSLKEQALNQLREVNAMLQFQTTGGETSAIRRALEALPND